MIRTLGYPVPVNMRDGKPLCPCCQDAMVKASPNTWQCALTVAVFARYRDALTSALDRAISDDER
jgi:hypothetical protein